MEKIKNFPPLILLHGYRGSWLGLEDLAGRLRAGGFRVYVPNLPPFGGRSNSLKKYDAEFYADFVKKYIKKQNIKQPILIGHSMGSLVAAAAAERLPEKLDRRVIFLAPIVRPLPKWLARLEPLGAYLPNSIVSLSSTAYLIVNFKWREFWRIYVLTKRCAKNFTSRCDMKLAGEFADSTAIADFKFNKIAFFVVGDHDRLATVADVKNCAKKYQNSKIEVLKNAGHLLNYQNFEEVAAAIENFIKV